jgi:hypothetical protein
MGVVPQDFAIGTPVRWFVSEKNISPYVGRVTHVVPATNKVWVAWPVGYPTQHEPYELIIVPPEQGISPINEDYSGYDSYEKQQSEKAFGVMQPQIVEKMASKVSMDASISELKQARRDKLASKVAGSFSAEVLENVKTAASGCKESGQTDLQAYSALYSKYASKVSDDAIKDAILSTYE